MSLLKHTYKLLIIITVNTSLLKAQVTDADIKVAYMYRFTDYIDWQFLKKSDNFSIGIFSDDSLILKKFEYLAIHRKIKEHKISIIPLDNINELSRKKFNLVYLNKVRSKEVLPIFNLTKGKNTLLITDDCRQKESVMINFLPSESGELVRFEINKKNTLDEGFIIHTDILLLGGSYVDVRKLFQEKELELEILKEKLHLSKLEVLQQEKNIKKQDSIIEIKEYHILEKNRKISQQESKLKEQIDKLSILSEEIENKKRLLENKFDEIIKQDKEIELHKESLALTKSAVKEQKEMLKQQEELIRKQENILSDQLYQIQFQRIILYISLIFIVLIMIVAYLIYKNFRTKKRANIKLRQFNDEILAQNEEIKAQREEIRNAHDRLRVANIELEKLSVVASKTNSAVIIMNSDGLIEWINEGFEKLFGYNFEELTTTFGKNLAEASSFTGIEKKLAECKINKKTIEYLNLNASKSGKKMWMHTSLTPILDDTGNVTKLIAIETNVTELKKAEESIKRQKEEIEEQRDEIIAQRNKVEEQNIELETYKRHLENLVEKRTRQLLTAKEKAEESDRLKSAFIANMSHEIRTPMNAVIGFSSLLNQSDITEKKSRYFINIINENANSLLHLIDDIIDLSKIEAGQLLVKNSSFDFNGLFDELFVMYKEKIIKDNHQIELELNIADKNDKFIIVSDKFRIKQVLINLLDNALKFTSEGFVKFGYKVLSTNKYQNLIDEGDEKSSFKHFLQIYVQDTGIGIEKNNAEMIFKRFSKIEGDKMKLYRGTGLGLSICKAIVVELGGKIWVDSEPGRGAVFYFTIPLRE